MPSGRRRSGGNKGDRGLAGTDIALEQAQHRRACCKVSKNFINGPPLITRPRCLSLCGGAAEPAEDVRFNGGQLRFGWRDAEGAAAGTTTTAMDKRNLHREEFIEGEAAECRIPKVKLLWPVQRLNRLCERHEPIARLHRIGQRINKVRAELVEKASHRAAQAQGRYATGQAIDGDDTTGADLVPPANRAELWRLKLLRPPHRLHAPGGDNRRANGQATFNEPSSVPDCIDCSRVVDERCDRALNATTPRLLNAKVGYARRNRGAGSPNKLRDRRDLAAILIATWQVGQQVGNGGDAELCKASKKTRATWEREPFQ